MKKVGWMLGALIVAGGLFGTVIYSKITGFQQMKEAMANRPEPEFPVTTVKVDTVNWIPTIQAIGFIEPNQGVTLTSESNGVIKKIEFQSGETVSKGKKLVILDTEVEKANLESAKARFPAAQAKYKRYEGLYKKGSVSKESFDSAEADYFSLRADIQALEAAIDRREISAPFDGIVGIRNVFLGQYLQPGTEIVRLEDTSVMRLRFTIPQTDISKIYLGQEVDIAVESYPEETFKGSISAVEPAVDHQTGLVQVQADIPNNGGKLRSGMFARAEVILPTIHDQVVLPQTAITYTLYGDNVYVASEVDGALRVQQQVVKVGERKEDIAHILEGVKAGDVIVTSGQIRLRNGAKVKVVESDALNTPDETPML
ncbi:efflux RND transporter periplasmic adaptor subunit [Vibrio hannami]|uniref:efflux RND transporter periplasmic adaptor subunit n=1 Tax=Vibrio hannami TaxID=2717094 RepID=UPI00240F2533|nr:efflux RND transporter periplasmic adaptor subunit [Vibrio hannami]MDG3086793.1 efflux RND transporter periplasmic adaptor subunit [Vibrio hannami]